MVKFSENAESNLPGGAHWVTADGNVGQVLDSLAKFVEKLRCRKMSKEDRKDLNIVVAALKKCCGKWLLCLDNADIATDPEVSKVFDRVCSSADPVKQNGWVIVTTTQGRSTLWDSMKEEQHMELGPLSKGETMCLLTRFANSINASETDDASIISDVYRLKETNRVECDALFGFSTILGGLPLVLVQAGTYIHQLQCTFSVYLKRYKEADGQAEIAVLLRRSRKFAPVKEEQRATHAIWKISVGRLSRDALNVLGALSMLGNAPMPKNLVNRILEKTGDYETPVFIKSLLLVEKELVHGTSLVQLEKRGRHVVYNKHRLVRLFALVEMNVRSEEWNVAFDLAANCTSKCIAKRLKKEGRPFDSLDGLDAFNRPHRTWVSHAWATVHHCSRFYSRGNENRDMIQLSPIHQYAGVVVAFFGRYEEQKQVWEGLLRIEWHHHGSMNHPNTASALGNLTLVLGSLGKFDEAERTQRECLEMRRAIYGHGVNHREIAATLGYLGNVYKDLGKLDEAEKMQLVKREKGEDGFSMVQDSLCMFRTVFGANSQHPSVVQVEELIQALKDAACEETE